MLDGHLLAVLRTQHSRLKLHLRHDKFEDLLPLKLYRNLRGAGFLGVGLDLQVLQLCITLYFLCPFLCTTPKLTSHTVRPNNGQLQKQLPAMISDPLLLLFETVISFILIGFTALAKLWKV